MTARIKSACFLSARLAMRGFSYVCQQLFRCCGGGGARGCHCVPCGGGCDQQALLRSHSWHRLRWPRHLESLFPSAEDQLLLFGITVSEARRVLWPRRNTPTRFPTGRRCCYSSSIKCRLSSIFRWSPRRRLWGIAAAAAAEVREQGVCCCCCKDKPYIHRDHSFEENRNRKSNTVKKNNYLKKSRFD